MKITCPSCQSRYTVSDEKVQGKTVKMKCRKCAATIVVSSGGVVQVAGNVEGASAAPPPTTEVFVVSVADGDQRNMGVAEIAEALRTGLIDTDTYVWNESLPDWLPLGDVSSLARVVQDAAQEAQFDASLAPVAAQSQAPVVLDSLPAEAMSQPSPARRESPGARPDLFSASSASSNDEVATSAPVVPRLIDENETRAPGQRDENSILFSLTALTAGAANQRFSHPSREDSGLIDLHALAQGVAGAEENLKSDFPSDAALFPLGAPPPSAAAAMPVVVPNGASASKSSPLIALGVVAAVVCIGVAVFALRKEPAPPAQAEAAAPVVPAEAPTQPSASPPPVETAAQAPAAVASSEKSPEKEPAAVKAVSKGRPSTKQPNAVPAQPAAAPPPPAAAPPKKSGGCGCAPGDLLCAMKCSAK